MSSRKQILVSGANDGIGLGEYHGGNLWIYDEAGDDIYTVPPDASPIAGYPKVIPGARLRGKSYNIKHRWYLFNGNIPHVVEHFTGDRISIVAYCGKDSYLSTVRSPSITAL